MNQISNPKFPKEGVFAALTLPSDAPGILKKELIQDHVIWLQGKGVHGLLVLGSTGEFPWMTPRERLQAVETVMSVAGPMSILVNVSDVNPHTAMEIASAVGKMNVSGLAIMPPLLYSSSDDDQLAYFLKVADKAPNTPILLYNFPELAGNRISISTISKFADSARMGGIKQSGAEFHYHEDLIALSREKGFSVFTGADTRLPEVLRLGAHGCIGGLVNAVPELIVEQFETHLKAAPEPNRSHRVSAIMRELGAVMEQLDFPLNVKAALAARGFHPGIPRNVLSENTMNTFHKTVSELREKFISWELPLFTPRQS